MITGVVASGTAFATKFKVPLSNDRLEPHPQLMFNFVVLFRRCSCDPVGGDLRFQCLWSPRSGVSTQEHTCRREGNRGG
jgi:hypothetical protein